MISLSLMYCQMIRVISSPSSSTTGLVTLIFAMTEGPFSENRAFGRVGDYTRPIALQGRPAEAKPLCSFSPSFR